MAHGTRLFGFIQLYFGFWCLLSVAKTEEFTRKLKTEFLCPDDQKECPFEVNGTYMNLAHTRADGPHDTFHYIHSTVGTPTILVAQTEPSSNLTIDWAKFMSNDTAASISFTGKTFYSYAVIFTRLIEYDDVNDTADLSKMDQHNNSVWLFHQLNFLPWDNSGDFSTVKDNFIVFHVNTSSETLSFNEEGSLFFKMQTFGAWDRNDKLPHLQYTSNTTQFDIILQGVNTNFNHSRFALEITLVTKEVTSAELNSTRSIDDEHSPGIFELVDWTAGGLKQTTGAYLQWKPVCYTDIARTFKQMNRATMYDLNLPEGLPSEISPQSVAFAYFGEDLYDNTLSISATNISFGLPKDDFYIKTNYTLWAASIGFGAPPVDTMSSLIMIVISVGLGLPAILIIFGGLGVCIKRQRDIKNASPYTSIQ